MGKVPAGLVAGPLDGREPVWIQQGGAWKRTTTGAIAALAGLDFAALTTRLAVIERAIGIERTAREEADAATGQRLAAVESQPEEAAHFTASAKMPALSLVAPVTLTLTGLIPARAGDRVRAGEAVVVAPRTSLPGGVNIAAATATADDVVTLQLNTTVHLGAGTKALVWDVTVLR